MKTMSFSEYENELDSYQLAKSLENAGIPKTHFIRATLSIAKSVKYLVDEEYKVAYFNCIEIIEKFLSGKATMEECKEIVDASAAVAHTAAASAAYYAAAGAFHATGVSITTGVSIIGAAPVAYYVSSNASYAAGLSFILSDIDILREYFPWDFVCAFQISQVLNKSKDELFVKELSDNQQLIQYATVILEDVNLKEEFKFLMKSYIK